jgi:hypothetical protein
LVSIGVRKTWAFVILSDIHGWLRYAFRVRITITKFLKAILKALERHEVQTSCTEKSM